MTNFRLFQTERVCSDNFKFDANGRKLSKWVENTVGKGEIARCEQFLLFPQCFQNACFPGASKGVIVWEWVNPHKLTIIETFNCIKLFCILTLSQTSPCFYVSAVKVLKTLLEKEKLLITSNFSLSQCSICCYLTFCCFYQIANCHLQTLAVWKSLKVVFIQNRFNGSTIS